MKNKSIFRFIPIIAVAIILLIKWVFPDFANNNPGYLYLLIFSVVVSAISTGMYWYHNKPDRKKMIMMAVGLVVVLIIFLIQLF